MGMRIIGGLRTTGGSSHTHDLETPVLAQYVRLRVLEAGERVTLGLVFPPAGEGILWEDEDPGGGSTNFNWSGTPD